MNVGIDALRGLAVMLVWCHHIAAYAAIELPLLGRLGGLLGVQLFFVISGYLIVRSAQRERIGAYATRRLLRILPAYWAVVAVVTLLSPRVSMQAVQAEPFAFVVNLLALSHWWPPALQFFDVTTVNWTLAVELAWYALVPILVWMVPRGSPRGWWIALMAVSLVGSTGWVIAAQSGAFDALFARGIAAAGVSPVNPFMRFAYIVNAAPAHLAFFVAGALVLRFEGRARRLSALPLIAVCLVFVPFADRWNDALGLHPSFASGIGLTALFVLVALRDGARAGAPHRAGLQAAFAWVGKVSYPVYLIHVPVLLATLALLRDRWQAPGWIVTAVAGAATLALSALLHRVVEQPGIALGRSLTQARQSAAMQRSGDR